MKIKKIDNRKKYTLLTVAILCIVAVGGYLVYAYAQNKAPFYSTDRPDADGRKISTKKSDFEKSVEEDLRQNPDKKQDQGVDIPAAPSIDQTSGKQQASALLTGVSVIDGKVSARGMVTDVVESDGTCTFTFEKDNLSVVKTTKAIRSSTSTSCESAIFPKTELESGTWRVVLSYESDASTSGISSLELEVK